MIITDKAQIKIAELKESNNLRLSESDELECYELIESDLKLPADVTFTRSSVAYLSDGTQVPANTPRFEQGKFGKAIMVEEGTTNLYPYPDFSSKVISYDGLSEEVIDDSQAKTGKALRAICIDSELNQAARVGTYSFTPGTSGTFSVYIKGIGDSIGCKPRVYFGAGGSEWVNSDIPLTDEYQRYVFNDVVTSGEVRVGLIGHGWKLNSGIEICDPQFEAKPYATSFIDGTRAAETLTIPTEGVLNPQEGTVEILLYVNQAIRDPSAVRRFFEHQPGPGNSNRITMQYNNTSHWFFTIGDANGNVHSLGIADSEVADGWRLFAMKWGASEFAVYVDGVKKTSISNPTYLPSAVGQNIIIRGAINTLIDDLRISSIARSDEEILAAYQSGQPLPADEWTTYKLDFDDKVRITTQGQIICNELIEI